MTHLWFKANRAKTLSMLKYDSYGWFDRPSEKDFASMLDREKVWKKELEQQGSVAAANVKVTVSNAAYKRERSRSGDDSEDDLEI